MPNIPEEIIKMVRPEGFDRMFYETLAETGLPDRMVFKILNDLYKGTFGIPRYKNFDSYRVVRDRRLNARRN